jgi:hypothetical protein
VSSCAHAIIADGTVPVARKLVPVSVILHFLACSGMGFPESGQLAALSGRMLSSSAPSLSFSISRS